MMSQLKIRSAAFTLIELLAVISILILVASFSMPALISVLKGSALTQGGQIVSDQLSLARQAALARNRRVEVRFFQYGDPEIPGETAGNASSGRYRGLQIFEIQDSGDAVALGKFKCLPKSVIIDQGATLSPIINKGTKISPDQAAVKIPPAGTDYNSVALRFQTNGSIAYASSSDWFLTVHELNEGDNLAQLKGNFVILRVDPINGKTRTFRP